MTCRGKTRNLQVNSGQPEGGRRSYQGAEKVYRVVINQPTPLEPGSQKTVGNHAPGRPQPTEIASQLRGSNPPRTQTELTIPAATIPAMVPIRLTAPSVPGRNRTPGRDQASLLAEGLAQFAGDRVGGSFGERRRHRQQEECPVVSRRAKAAAQAVATPRLARTWDAFRPSRRSAVPNSALR